MEAYFRKRGNILKFIRPHPHLKGQVIEMGMWELVNEFGTEGLKELREKYPIRESDEDK